MSLESTNYSDINASDHTEKYNIKKCNSFSFENWNSGLKELELSQISTTSKINNLLLMGRGITEYHHSLKSLLLDERTKSLLLAKQINFYKLRYEKERKKRIDLQLWLQSNIPDFQSIFTHTLNEDSFSSTEQEEKDAKIHEVENTLNYSDVCELDNLLKSIPKDSVDIREELKRLSNEYQSSLISETSTYKQMASQQRRQESLQHTRSPSTASFCHSESEHLVDPTPCVVESNLQNDEPNGKWGKVKELEAALHNLRKQKETLFKETESILLLKRQLVTEIQILEHHKSMLNAMGKKHSKVNPDATELKNTIQSELEFIRASGISHSQQSTSNPVFDLESSQSPTFIPLPLFSANEPEITGPSKSVEGDDTISQSDSSSLSSYPNSFPEGTHPLLSPKPSFLLSNRRASLGSHFHDNSITQKKSKKNGKFQIGLTTVSNVITKFKDKLNNEDMTLAFGSLVDPAANAYSEFQSKGSNSSYIPFKGSDVSCVSYSELDYKPHSFSITRLDIDLPCCVCQQSIFKNKSKELKCIACNVVSHARCAPFILESCLTTCNSTISSTSSRNSMLITSQLQSTKETSCLHSIPSSVSFFSKSLSPQVSSDSFQEPSKMFGVDLVTQVYHEGRSVPLILEICLSSVEAFGGLGFEGIYRKSGPAQCIRSLVQAFDNGLIPDLRVSALSSLTSNSDPLKGTENDTCPLPAVDLCVTTSVLKQYLRELPNPLITFAIYPVVCNAVHKSVSKVREALKDLPKPHWDTLMYLFRHLKLIIDNASVNRMNSRNLGVVFGPTLMRHASHTDVYDMAGIQVVEYLLDHYTEIFEDFPLAPPTTIYRRPSIIPFRDIHTNTIPLDAHPQTETKKDKHRRLSVIF